jgi:hypothetical protein
MSASWFVEVQEGRMSRIIRTAAIAAAALACTASPAVADDQEYTTEAVMPSWTAASAQSCADPDVAPLLSSFKDDDFYAPAPGGAFNDGAGGWQLDGGASVVDGDGALQLFGAGGGALELPVGATATSPTFCVDERYPHFRFSFAQRSLSEDADVRVEVIYPGLDEKNVRKAKDLKAKHGRGWELSDRIKLDPYHGVKRGGWRLVAVRIGVKSGKPGTSVRVDDVLVDPRARF